MHAQGNAYSIQTFPLLMALDTNHDGVISAQEIAAAPESLRSLDDDEDGQLSARECMEAADEKGPSLKQMVKMLMAHDKNGDGKLQRSELPERMQGLFDRGDLNKDGVLTMDEIRKLAAAEQASRTRQQDPDTAYRQRTEAMVMRVVPTLVALDANHDGVISEAEIRNAAAVLKSLDKNNDGQLTDDELAPERLRVYAGQVVALVDVNSDGRVSTDEASAPRAAAFKGTLLAADRQHHGFATEEEVFQELSLRVNPTHSRVVAQEEIQRAVQSGALKKEELRKQ